jgi:exodeoxyribonuclease V beta subunit
VFVYLQARGEAPAENRYSLDYNYRSTPPLLNALNAFFESSANPFLLHSISYQSVKAGRDKMDCLQIADGPDEALEIRQLNKPGDNEPLAKQEAKVRAAKDTAGQIRQILAGAKKGNVTIGSSPLEAKDISVLVRKHEQAELVKQALNKQGIKCIIHSESDVFKSEEARQLAIILKAVAEPADERLVAAALSTSLFDYNGNDLFGLQENGTRWAAKLEQFYRWHQLWQQHGFSFFFRMMMQQEKVEETAMKHREGERMLTNLRHLSGLIYETERKTGRGIHALLKWLLKKREVEKSNEEEQLRLESDENLVQVVTQHHSKGLEYPVVFCPFLWDVRAKKDNGSPLIYHDPADNNRMILDLSGKSDPDRGKKRLIQAKEELEESLRLMYVALTRAEQKCIISWVYANSSVYSPLGYLLLRENQAIKSLEAKFKLSEEGETDYSDLIQLSLEKLSHHPEISVQVAGDTNLESVALQLSDSSPIGKAKNFNRETPLSKGKSLFSFSSLTQRNHEVDLDVVDYYDEFIARESSGSQASGIFRFPKGPAPGTAIHHIFEHIDFQKDEHWDDVIHKYLQQEDIADRWQPVVRKMLWQTVNKSLIASKSSLKLAAIPPNQMVSEMQFHFASHQVELRNLLAIIRRNPPKGDSLESFAEEGFMTGFIDLTFRFGEQYYILDYKTNHLGNETEDYSREELCKAMSTQFYDLQYHLYLVALHRFLKQKLPDYDYRKHIGGALYLFIRGINEKSDAGIYLDRPEAACINELDRYFKENEL